MAQNAVRESGRVTLLLSAGGDDAGLVAELGRSQPALSGRVDRPGLILVEPLPGPEFSLPPLALVRQVLPNAERVHAMSVSAWARAVVERILAFVPEDAPWRLHVGAQYGLRPRERMGARAWHSAQRRQRSPISVESEPFELPRVHAGERRCALIRESVRTLLKERRRKLERQCRDETGSFTPNDSLVQVLLTSADEGWISGASAPQPWSWRQTVSPFVLGEIPRAVDLTAPSRAFAKLVEAEQRFGQRMASGETCVDLGASPGSWSYVALQRGAQVIAVDRSPLRDDLMKHPAMRFVRADAFAFEPPIPVDWLLCDVIAASERSIELVLNWLRHDWAHSFVVTIKLKGPADYGKLDQLKRELPALTDEWFLNQLCANKGEVCVFGRARNGRPSGQNR